MVVQWDIPDIISINLRIIHYGVFLDTSMEKSMEESRKMDLNGIMG